MSWVTYMERFGEPVQREMRRMLAGRDIATLSVVELQETARKAQVLVNNRRRRERDAAMRSIGMKKVRGNLGGTYWE